MYMNSASPACGYSHVVWLNMCRLLLTPRLSRTDDDCFFFPFLKGALVVSQPVNACCARRTSQSAPSSPLILHRSYVLSAFPGCGWIRTMFRRSSNLSIRMTRTSVSRETTTTHSSSHKRQPRPEPHRRHATLVKVLRSFISCALLYGLARNWDCVVVVVASSITSMSADDLVVIALRFCSMLLMVVVWSYPSNMMVVFDL